jgi:hypothetical protein
MKLPLQVGFVWADPEEGHDTVPDEADIRRAIVGYPIALVEPVDADFGVWLARVGNGHRAKFESEGWLEVNLGNITMIAEAP